MKLLLISLCLIHQYSDGAGLSPLSYIHSMRNKLSQRLNDQHENLENVNPNRVTPTRAPLYKFNGDIVTNEDSNVDNIFSLLADINPNDPIEFSNIMNKQKMPETLPLHQVKPIPDVKNDIRVSDEDANIGLINQFSKKTLSIAKEMEDLVSTVTKVKDMYMTKKKNQQSLEKTSANIPSNSSQWLDLFLNTSSLEKMWDAGVMARDQDELLEELTSVIIGAESRQGGSALTLDPVTIIALLTLAAYLIRAVYQILTVTGRSIDGGFNPADVSLRYLELPQAMANVHNWISSTKLEFSSEGRAIDEEPGWTTVTGTVMGLVKLQREGEHQCYQKMLCQHLQGREGAAVAPEDLFIMVSNYIYGEDDFSLYIDNALGMPTQCSRFSCQMSKIKDAQKVQMMYTAALKYLNTFYKRFRKQ